MSEFILAALAFTSIGFSARGEATFNLQATGYVSSCTTASDGSVTCSPLVTTPVPSTVDLTDCTAEPDGTQSCTGNVTTTMTAGNTQWTISIDVFSMGPGFGISSNLMQGTDGTDHSSLVLLKSATQTDTTIITGDPVNSTDAKGNAVTLYPGLTVGPNVSFGSALR